MLPTPDSLDRTTVNLAEDLAAFAPELVLCGGVVLMLFLRLFDFTRRLHLAPVALAVSAAAFVLALLRYGDPAGPLFTGLLIADDFANFARVLLLGTLVLLMGVCVNTGIPDREDSADFGTLALGATLGMMLMAQANHLLTLFIAVEMASLPSYAMAGFLKGRRTAGEASLKYVIYGAASAGVMLYGISLITGQLGTGALPDVAAGFAAAFADGNVSSPLAAGAVFVLVGLGFKLAAVPFHFWCPDVFEGAAAEVAAFLSVASKAAAVVLTARVAFSLAPAFPEAMAYTLGTLGALTATLGNLAALGQSNLKRLLAYSTIAHAGYMLLAVALLNEAGLSAVLFYLVAYLLMNLGAFAVVALVRNRVGTEELPDAAGLLKQSPALVVLMTLFLMGLLGLPPLAGFAAKFQIFAALYDAGAGDSSAAWFYSTLLGVAVVNTVISAAYYLRVIRVMALDDPPEALAQAGLSESPGGPRGVPVTATLLLTVMALATVALGVFWDPLTDAAALAASSLTPSP